MYHRDGLYDRIYGSFEEREQSVALFRVRKPFATNIMISGRNAGVSEKKNRWLSFRLKSLAVEIGKEYKDHFSPYHNSYFLELSADQLDLR